MNKCLYCYERLSEELDYHEKCAKVFFGTSHVPTIEYTYDQMNELAKKVVEQSVSVPGVQPKLSMSLIQETRQNHNARLTVVGALDGNYIFKPPTDHYPEMPQNEHVTMRIAEVYNIRVVPSTLIRLKSGELSYITRRIDRGQHGEKVHMLDMCQITEAFDKYRSSMERIGKALANYSENTLLDLVYLFELTIFSFLTGNNDMHLKNFSMIKSSEGWVLAPSYDLLNVTVVLPEDKEELALTLEGKKRNFKHIDFVRFGEKLGLTNKQTEAVFKRMLSGKPKAIEWIERSFLSEEMKSAYLEVLDIRYRQIELG